MFSGCLSIHLSVLFCESYLHLNVPGRNFCPWKRLIGAVQRISGNFSAKGHWAVGTFVNQKDLLGQCWAYLKIWGPKVKGQVYHMTKYVQSYSLESITAFRCTRCNFCQWKKLTGAVLSISENLRVKGQSHPMTKCKNTVLELII